jgi:fused signal recognition particle receptor
LLDLKEGGKHKRLEVHQPILSNKDLEKIRRIASREIAGAPHETLLVLDAGIGRNSLVQAREFLKFSGLSGVFLSKLDGTAKGGSVLGIAEELRLPIQLPSQPLLLTPLAIASLSLQK